jgi:hypothetical protein
MASEISHVVYAARLLTYLGKKVKDPSYWAGTLFPNIRHLNGPSRHLTHPEKVGLSSLVGKNDFLTGMRVHAWIDATQGHYLDMQHSKETLPWHPLIAHAYKLLEDEVVYDTFDDWELIRRVLMKVREDELFYVDSRLAIQKWHGALQDYVRHHPSDKSRLAYMEAMDISPSVGEEINHLIARLKEDRRTKKVMEDFWQHLERLLH